MAMHSKKECMLTICIASPPQIAFIEFFTDNLKCGPCRTVCNTVDSVYTKYASSKFQISFFFLLLYIREFIINYCSLN